MEFEHLMKRSIDAEDYSYNKYNKAFNRNFKLMNSEYK